MQKLFQENGNFNGKVYHEFTFSDVFIDFEVFNQCNMKVQTELNSKVNQ